MRGTPGRCLDNPGRLAGLNGVHEAAHVSLPDVCHSHRAQLRDDMAGDAAPIGGDSRFSLRAFALAQHQALFGGGKVVAAELGHGHRPARGIAGRGGVLARRHAPKGFACPLARFLGCQHPNPPQGELSCPAGRISVLDDPCAGARWLGAQSEAGQVVIPIQRVALHGLQGIHESLGELGQGSLRKSWPEVPLGRGHSGDTGEGKPEQFPEFPRSFSCWLNCCIRQAQSPYGNVRKTRVSLCHCL